MSGTSGGRINPQMMYDLSIEERKAIGERAKIRAAYKAEWIKKTTNPYRGVNGTIFDPQVMRWNAMKATGFEHFKATPKTGAWGFAIGILPIIVMYAVVRWDRGTRERAIRNGEVDYTDRNFKFI